MVFIGEVYSTHQNILHVPQYLIYQSITSIVRLSTFQQQQQITTTNNDTHICTTAYSLKKQQHRDCIDPPTYPIHPTDNFHHQQSPASCTNPLWLDHTL